MRRRRAKWHLNGNIHSLDFVNRQIEPLSASTLRKKSYSDHFYWHRKSARNNIKS